MVIKARGQIVWGFQIKGRTLMVVGWENKTNKKNMTDWKTNRTNLCVCLCASVCLHCSH